MKKKFINGLLMAAAFVTATGSMVSCTDKEEDRLQEFQQALLADPTINITVVNDLADSLKALRNELNLKIASIKQCNCDIDAKLAGYALIADVYTKSEIDGKNFATVTYVDGKLANYALVSDLNALKIKLNDTLAYYYMGSKIDELLGAKVDTASVYTRQQIIDMFNEKLADNATKTWVLEQLGNIKGGVDSAWVANYVNNLFKEYYTKHEVDSILTNYYLTSTQIKTMFQDYYTKNQIDSIQKLYYTKTEILEIMSDSLANYAKTSWVNANFYNKTQIDDKIKNLITEEQAIAAILRELQNAGTLINHAVDSIIENKLDNKLYGTGDEKMTTHELVDAYLALRDIAVQAAADATEALRIAHENAETLAQHGLDIEYLKDLTSNLKDRIGTIESDITKLKSDLATLIAKVNAQDARLTAHGDSLKTLDGRLDEVDTRLDGIDSHLKNHCDSLKNLYDSIATLRTTINELDSFTRANIDTLNTKLSKIEEAYKAADQLLQNQIDKVKSDLSTLTDRVSALEDDMAKVKKTLDQLPTEIRIDGTENPLIGEAAAPLGIRTNILAAHYGYIKVNGGVTFPAPTVSGYVSGDNVDPAELAGAPTETFSKDESTKLASADNAGTLYLTVNPNTVDFTGKEMKLVNSQGEEAGITLSPLKKSNHTLAFGYDFTRASNTNFYEAAAELTNVSAAMPRYDATSMKAAGAAIKELLSRKNPSHDQLNAGKVAVALYKNMSNILDRYAVQGTYEDGDGNEHSYTSGYDLAAVAVRALPYSFAKDFTFDHFPGYSRIEKTIGKLIDGVKINLGLSEITLSNMTIKKVTLSELSPELKAKFRLTLTLDTNMAVPLPSTVTVVIPEQQVKNSSDVVVGTVAQQTIVVPVSPIETTDPQDPTGPKVVGGIHFSYEFVYDLTAEIEQIYNQVQKPINDVNQMIDDINKWMDQITGDDGILNKIKGVEGKIDDAKNSIKKQIIHYIDLIDAKIAPYLNATVWLQPVVFVKADDAFTRLSGSEVLPTKVNRANFSLVTTSYTAEILAPAYRKFAMVTNVWNSDRTKSAKEGDATLKAAQNAANTPQTGSCTFKQLLDGDTNIIHFNGEAGKGYIYEILYEAMDYEGNIVAQKYYVQVM